MTSPVQVRSSLCSNPACFHNLSHLEHRKLAVFLHIIDVAEVVFIQVPIHGLLVAVGRTSYHPSCDVTSFRFLLVIHIHVQVEQLL
jgi:hypothetical protein